MTTVHNIIVIFFGLLLFLFSPQSDNLRWSQCCVFFPGGLYVSAQRQKDARTNTTSVIHGAWRALRRCVWCHSPTPVENRAPRTAEPADLIPVPDREIIVRFWCEKRPKYRVRIGLDGPARIVEIPRRMRDTCSARPYR